MSVSFRSCQISFAPTIIFNIRNNCLSRQSKRQRDILRYPCFYINNKNLHKRNLRKIKTKRKIETKELYLNVRGVSHFYKIKNLQTFVKEEVKDRKENCKIILESYQKYLTSKALKETIMSKVCFVLGKERNQRDERAVYSKCRTMSEDTPKPMPQSACYAYVATLAGSFPTEISGNLRNVPTRVSAPCQGRGAQRAVTLSRNAPCRFSPSSF